MKKNTAFTLIELSLSIILVFGLLSALVFNLTTINKKSQLIEFVYQIEGLIRYVKAESEFSGKKFKLNLSKEIVEITYENDPIESPNEYINFNSLWIYPELSENTIESSIIEFYSDGSCSSSDIEIQNKNNPSLKYIISINELGIINHREFQVDKD